jgi:tetratricopeptide (TPR) repeat protein
MIIVLFTGCSRAGDFYREGKKNLMNGDYKKAAACFSSAVSVNPERADYYINYGLSLIKLGEYEKAITVFDRAYMNKDMSIIRENDKKILRGKGISYYLMRQYDKAVQEFDKALDIKELSELDMDILFYKAAAIQSSGLYEDAIKEYTKLLKHNEGNAFVYAKRAVCYRLIGDMDKSLADYDSAIKLKPDKYEYYFGKYYIMKEMGDKSGAKAVLKQAQKLQGDTDTDKYNKALVHYYQGKYDTALGELTECLSNEYKEAGYYIGEIYRIRKDYTNANYYYEKYITDGGEDFPNAFNQIAVCLMKTGDYEEALKYIEKGLALNDVNRERIFRKNEITAYEYLGRYEEADIKLLKYLEDYPGETEAKREAVFIDTRLIDSN